MKKLFEGARDNGIAGFTAYTAPDNQGMISLFNSLPVHVFTAMEDGLAALSCRFDDMKTNLGIGEFRIWRIRMSKRRHSINSSIPQFLNSIIKGFIYDHPYH